MRGRNQDDGSTPRDKRNDYWGVNIDAPDANELARFYAEVLGWEITSSDANDATIGPPDGVAYLAFQTERAYVRPAWPATEGRQQMMMHLDFEVSDLEAAVAHALELGAEQPDFQPQKNVRVLLDPVGHPFCLYQGE
jgi:predicted enzyme related to lactoylglutathione lyase